MWIDSYAKAVLEPFGLANRCGMVRYEWPANCWQLFWSQTDSDWDFRGSAAIHRSTHDPHVSGYVRSQFMAANEESLQEILRRNPSLSSDQFQERNLAMRSEYCRPDETVLDILIHFRLARLMTTHHYSSLLMATYVCLWTWQILTGVLHLSKVNWGKTNVNGNCGEGSV